VVESSYKAQVVVAIVCPNQLLSVLGAPNCPQTVQGPLLRPLIQVVLLA